MKDLYQELNNAERMNIIKSAVLKYGQTEQSIIAMEECSELIKEISKLVRVGEYEYAKVDNITEEIADVLIMIEQLKLIYRIDERNIETQINYKLNRLKERMKK